MPQALQSWVQQKDVVLTTAEQRHLLHLKHLHISNIVLQLCRAREKNVAIRK